MSLPVCPILGSNVAVTTYDEAISTAAHWAALGDRPYAIAAANTHLISLARSEPSFKNAISAFDLLLPDGMPLVWYINRHSKTPLKDRVYGPTFMLRCLAQTPGAFSHYFLGGSEELLAALLARLATSFPNMSVAGSYSPPFGNWDATEDQRILDRIQASGARYVWVGLGCPKQELWLARLKTRLPPAVYCAVGAAFAFHAGRVRQAPLWMQSAGLEWSFRLATEPRRLWKRYLLYNSLFIYYLLKEALTAS